MIYQNIELFNVAEAVQVPGRPGVLLQRVPEEVRGLLREVSQTQLRQAACCEIRFVSDWKPVNVTLVSYGTPCMASIYLGDFQVGQQMISTEPTKITVTIPSPHFLSQPDFDASLFPFSPAVSRVMFAGQEIHFLSIEGESIRPPKKEETPQLRFLAYGTSITQGYAATNSELTYVKQLAWRLGADAINLGVSGSAFCEKPITDYIVSRDDWDFATLCLSVNMLNQEVPAASFSEIAKEMIMAIAKKSPQKPVFCISLLPSCMDIGFRWPERNPTSTADEYRRVIQTIVEEANLSNLHYIDGKQLISNLTGLSHDLLHPSDHGMIEIGEKLAKLIRPLL